MARQKRLTSFLNAFSGILIEIFAAFMLMGAVFIAGLLILKWFSR